MSGDARCSSCGCKERHGSAFPCGKCTNHFHDAEDRRCDDSFHLALANDAIRLGLSGWACECGAGYPTTPKVRP